MNGKPSLADSYLKVSRAKEHLEDLRSEHSAFTRTRPYSILPEDDVEQGLYRLRFKIEDTPPRLSLILGDLMYCLRSSLDQLVWALAQLSTPYPEGTQFPIFAEWNSKSSKRFAKLTAGVPTAALTIIDSFQPYHAGSSQNIQSHLLWRLNLLCNIDKHRRIPVHGSGVQWTNVIPLEAALQLRQESSDTVTIPLSFKDQVNLSPMARFEVYFGDLTEGIQCDFSEVEKICNFVAEGVLPQFVGFF